MNKPVFQSLTLTPTSPETEYSKQFLQGMLNRMSVSFHRYGPVADAYPDKVHAVRSLYQRLVRYEETGNTEFLIDVANFAMIEFLHPHLPNAHFTPTDSDASPGRTSTDGAVTHAANAEIP
jgi:hypothetical protein